jgi:hypothetical protein
MDSQCFAGIDMKKWNILTGNLGHHKHGNYKHIVEIEKEEPHKYWPRGFKTI